MQSYRQVIDCLQPAVKALGIMVKGQLKCVGSPQVYVCAIFCVQFRLQNLIAKYGDGYTLEIKYTQENASAALEKIANIFVNPSLVEEYLTNSTFSIRIEDSQLATVNVGFVLTLAESDRSSNIWKTSQPRV